MPASGFRVFRPLAAVAAHAMTPDLGQGAGQAIEDAVVPAAALSSGRVDSGVSTVRRRATQPDGEDRKGGPTYRQACSTQAPIAVSMRTLLRRLIPPSLSLRMVQRITAWTLPLVPSRYPK
jgi:2-polyprenyl-6-methoxyphenol hydroxylase-like FAD-dependent oxidoreductase